MGEWGSSTVEVAIATVLVVTLLLAVVQLGVYFHARSVAATAARQGLDTARGSEGTAAAGDQVATQFLNEAGGALVGESASVSRTPTEVTVTVSGSALSVLPGVSLPVTVTVRAPVERVVE